MTRAPRGGCILSGGELLHKVSTVSERGVPPTVFPSPAAKKDRSRSPGPRKLTGGENVIPSAPGLTPGSAMIY